MTPAEKKVLLAAAASPLRINRGWLRTDTPAPQRVDSGAVWGLLETGLLERLPRDAHVYTETALTPAGLVQANAIRHVLGRRRRKILAAIYAAGELVRRARAATEAEQCEILAGGGAPAETVTEWVAPLRNMPPPVEGPGQRHWVPDRICSGSELQGLVDRGLAVLLNGGSRAVLSGAGRWCAEEADHG